MEIAFAVVEAPGNSLELHISANEQYPSHKFSSPHTNTPMEQDVGQSHNPYDEVGTAAIGDDDSDGADPVPDRSAVNLNTIPEIIEEDATAFEVHSTTKTLVGC